jgi:hypothetical protein
MEWFKKFFGRDDYLSDQEKFAVLHRASNVPRGMMMLAGSSKPLEYAVYIRLPEQMAPMFAGYEKCEAPSESRVIGLYGHQEDLKEYIKQER